MSIQMSTFFNSGGIVPNVANYFYGTTNGYGSGSTKIRKYTTAITVSDPSALLTVINDNTLGNTYTVNRRCILSASIVDVSTSTLYCGISLNSAQLTTNINSITAANRLTMSIGPIADVVGGCAVTIIAAAGDVIRPHVESGTASSNASQGSFYVTAVEY